MKTMFSWAMALAILLLVASVVPPTVTNAQQGGFSDSFDDPSLAGWEHSENAAVVDGYLHLESGEFAFWHGQWGDMNLSIRLRRFGEGALDLRIRATDSGSYLILISSDLVSLNRESQGNRIELAQQPVQFPTEEWVQLGVQAVAGQITVSLNDKVVLSHNDDASLPPGGVMFQAEDRAVVDVDRVDLVPGAVSEPAPPTQPEPTGPAEPQAPGALGWVRTGGPPGGLGYDIRYDFDNPDIWYVTDAYAGVHISTDNGRTWQPSNQGIPQQAGLTGDGYPIFCLTIDPHDPQINWAGTSSTGHIYRSTDGGRSWEQRDNGVSIEYDALTFRGFTVDPRSSDIVYAMGETTWEPGGGPAVWGQGTGGVVYKTVDAGEHWRVIWDGGMPSSLTRYAWIDPRNPDVIYISTGLFDRGAVGEGDPETDPLGGIGILKSRDGGQTWQVQNEANGLEMLYVGSLFMHPENPDILLAAAGHTTEARASYFERYVNEHGHTISGVFRTEDGGEHWTRVLTSANVGEVFAAVEICTLDPEIAYAASDIAVYRSQDGGVNWTQQTPGKSSWGSVGVLAGFPIDIQCDPRDTDRLFINNYSGGNFLSEDGGRTWQNASQGYTGALLRNVAVDPQYPARVYATGRSGTWRSDDGGTTWYGLSFSPPDFSMSFEQGTVSIDPHQPDHLLLGELPSTAMLESSDGGLSWDLRGTAETLGLRNVSGGGVTSGGRLGGVTFSNFIFAPTNSSLVYASLTHDFCYRSHEPCTGLIGTAPIVSRDGGSIWQSTTGSIPGAPEVIDLAVAPDDDQTLYAATWTGMFRSENGGSSWTMLPGLPGNAAVRAVAVDPLDSLHLVAGVEQQGVFFSRDGGQTWKAGIAGLEANGSLHDLVFDPTDPQVVYASDLLSGVYRSTDGGESWTKINEGLRTRSALGLAISSDGEHLYVATDGEGVFRLDLNDQAPQAAPTPANLPGPAPAAEAGVPAEGLPEKASGERGSGLPCAGGAMPVAIAGLVWVFRRRR